MNPSNKEHTPKLKRRAPSLIFWCVFLGASGYVSLLGFNVVNWYEHGFSTALQTIQDHTKVTLSELNTRNRWAQATMIAMSQLLSESLSHYGERAELKLRSAEQGRIAQGELNSKLLKEATHLESGGKHFLSILKLTFWQLSIKIMALLESIWVLACAAVVGAMDGLCKRYIRTSEGGRESTLLYHSAGKRFMLLPMSVILLYLALPLFVSGLVATMALALCVFIYFNVRMSCLKKYL